MGLASAGASTGSTSFDAWGKPIKATTGYSAYLGYQGDPTDPTTGQVDMGTRWYEPSLGRFGSRDSVFGDAGSPNSLNQFSYGGGNPITMVDPTGMRPLCETCTHPENRRTIRLYTYHHAASAGYHTGPFSKWGPPPVVPEPNIPPPDVGLGPPPGTWIPGEVSEVGGCQVVGYRYVCPHEDSEDDGDPGCDLLGWRCWDDPVINGSGWVAGHLPEMHIGLDGVSFRFGYPHECSNATTGVSATCYDNSPWAETLHRFGFDAMTVGHSIMCADECSPNQVVHETTHVPQQERDGFVFYTRYLWQGLFGGGYCSIDYEKEAYAAEGATCS